MANLMRDTEFDGQRPALWIDATVKDAERAWSQTRSEWGQDDAGDLDAVIVTLGATQCGVWVGDTEESAILIDTPADSAREMAESFGLALPAGAAEVLDDALIGYRPRAARYCEVAA